MCTYFPTSIKELPDSYWFPQFIQYTLAKHLNIHSTGLARGGSKAIENSIPPPICSRLQLGRKYIKHNILSNNESVKEQMKILNTMRATSVHFQGAQREERAQMWRCQFGGVEKVLCVVYSHTHTHTHAHTHTHTHFLPCSWVLEGWLPWTASPAPLPSGLLLVQPMGGLPTAGRWRGWCSSPSSSPLLAIALLNK